MIYTAAQLAKRMGISLGTLYYAYLSPGKIKPTGKMAIPRGAPCHYWSEEDAERAIATRLEQVKAVRDERQKRMETFAAKYKQGMTLSEIGAAEGVTRERVRQLLVKAGVKRTDGGVSIRRVSAAARNEQNKVMQRESHCQAVYGCSYAEFVAISGARRLTHKFTTNRLLHLYRHHRDQASRQKLQWQLTLPQYKELLNGREHMFGRGRALLVLMRKDSNGPFSLENCHVTTHSECSRLTNGFAKARQKRERLKKEAYVLYNRGFSIPAIAKHFSKSPGTIDNWIHFVRKQEQPTT